MSRRAPDKIFIPADWLCIPRNHYETEASPGATEYVRKDSFINKARKWFEENGWQYIDCYADQCRLMRDFIEAMEG